VFAQAALDDAFQTDERAAADERMSDVSTRYIPAADASATLGRTCRPSLPVSSKALADAFAGNVARDGNIFRFARDLVNSSI